MRTLGDVIGIFLMVLCTLGTIGLIVRVGKPRRPITNADAAVGTALNLLTLLAILLFWRW